MGKHVVTAAEMEAMKRLVDRWLDRCRTAGVDWEDFYRALLTEQRLHPDLPPAYLFEVTWARVKRVLGN